MKSIWRYNTALPTFESLKGKHKTDVLIIGGGITGLLTAYLLSKSSVPYILVEKNRICSGTTANTTAKITFQHGLIYDKLKRKEGTEIAKGYLCANKMAFDKYAELCSNIQCDYQRRDNFVYSTTDRSALEREVRALESIGYRASLYDSLPLPISTVGGVCFTEQAQFDPLKFLCDISKGLNIYEDTQVLDVEGNTAYTSAAQITAKRIVFATHFPFIDRYGFFFVKLYQHRSYVLALKGAKDLGGMYVDEDKTGLSFRNHSDILLLGGGGHRTGKRCGGFEELKAIAAIHYPEAKEITRWAAQDCMSLDGMCYIGSYSTRRSRWLCASGFNKWGMTGSMLSAILLCDAILGKANPYAHVFTPSRSIFKPQLFINALETATNLLTPFGKRCTHLGCKLKWNASEHTWDCACHGSRFSEDGEILDNPANKELL